MSLGYRVVLYGKVVPFHGVVVTSLQLLQGAECMCVAGISVATFVVTTLTLSLLLIVAVSLLLVQRHRHTKRNQPTPGLCFCRDGNGSHFLTSDPRDPSVS